MKLVFLIVSRAVSLLGLSRRESGWKDDIQRLNYLATIRQGFAGITGSLIT